MGFQQEMEQYIEVNVINIITFGLNMQRKLHFIEKLRDIIK